MAPIVVTIIASACTLIVGALIGYIYRKNVGEKAIGSAEQKAKNLVLDAENKSETLRKEAILEAKEEAQAEKRRRERRKRKTSRNTTFRKKTHPERRVHRQKIREYRKKRREHHPKRTEYHKQTEGSGQDHLKTARRAGEDLRIHHRRGQGVAAFQYRKGRAGAHIVSP